MGPVTWVSVIHYARRRRGRLRVRESGSEASSANDGLIRTLSAEVGERHQLSPTVSEAYYSSSVP